MLNKMQSRFLAGKKFTIVLVLICASLWLSAVTYEVKQDGSEDFTEIQAAIEAATYSDTVLVHPGTYYENIDYLGKSITVASLYLKTPADSLIEQTIIDGNQQDRCVQMLSCDNAVITGFTLQNGFVPGTGYWYTKGGAINIEYGGNTYINNCYIHDNVARSGGGIHVLFSQYLYLKGNKVYNNRARRAGGGLYLAGNELIVEFDSEDLNSVYSNYAPMGADIYLSILPTSVNIILDTFTVNSPDYFFISDNASGYTFSCLNYVLEEVDCDLYVAPDGDDANSGLTPDDPLQTIAWAQTLIKRNDENPNTIHLAEGIYSPSLNNQIFPLNVKHGVIYDGVSPEMTILDGENETIFFYLVGKNGNAFIRLVMQDLSMINGYDEDTGSIRIYQADLNLTNVVMENCNGNFHSVITTSNGYVNLTNSTFQNNRGAYGVHLIIEYNVPNPILQIKIVNCKIVNQQPSTEPDPWGGQGTPLSLGGNSSIPADTTYALVQNCEITGNHIDSPGSPSGLRVININPVDVINCSFGDNYHDLPDGCVVYTDNSTVNFYNNIVYQNTGYTFRTYEENIICVSHSNTEGGPDNVYCDEQATINWLEGNIDADPLFYGDGGRYPFYSLTSNSPCIDAGTTELPEGVVLSEFDLAGNPRVVGSSIDMGCYEWQGPQNTEDYELPVSHNYQLTNHPNPFTGETIISFNLNTENAENTEVEIYNVKGQLVKQLGITNCELGSNQIIWDASKFASGIYFYKLVVDGKPVDTKKMILLK